MSGYEERSAKEREAARIERERRRAQRSGPAIEAQAPQPASAEPASAEPESAEPASAQRPGAEPASADSESAEPLGAEPASAEPAIAEPFDFAAHEDPDSEPGADGHHEELPSGTRRVSGARRVRLRGERLSAAGSGGSGGGRIRRRASWRGRGAALVVLLLAAALIWFLVELLQPFHGSPHGSVRVTIPPHSGVGQIGDLLQRDGVIASSFFFQLRATLAGERGDLRSGSYKLALGMSYGDALKQLTTPPKAARVNDLTITEGRTRRQIDALLRSQGVHGSYLAATRHSRLLDPRSYGAPRATPSLEGFMFPSTYQVREPIKTSALVDDQLKTFKREFGKVDLRYAKSKHLSPYDVLTIASMVEAEAATAHDRPLIASVIYNRLRDQMPLQIDATTRYATGNYTKPLTTSELASPSPYNTRIHKGLPPTPIDNPGMAAIQAAAHPAQTNYLYFVVQPGSCNQAFTSSFKQFETLAQRYQNARARLGGRSPTHC